MKTTVTQSLTSRRSGSVSFSTRRDRVQKTMHPIWVFLVQPGRAVFVCSQERTAKKKLPRVRSAVCVHAENLLFLGPLARSLKKDRSSF